MTTATETTRISQMKDFWDSAKDEQKNLETRIRENLRFIVGQHWDPADLQALADAPGGPRPALTYNEILPKCNALVGEYLENAQQIQVYPRRGGVKAVANILTHLAKHAMDLCYGEYEEVACFLEGLAGQSNLAWDITYNNDPFNGDVQLRKVSAFRVVWDHEAREYDPNKSGRFVTEIWYWDKDEIEKTYPGKFSDEGINFSEADNEENDLFNDPHASLEDTYREAKTNYGGSSHTAKNKKHSIRCTWWKSFEMLEYLYSKGDSATAPNLKRLTKKQMPYAKGLLAVNPQKYNIIKRLGPVMHKTVYAGDIVLEDVDNPLGEITNYPLMRFCPYWIDGYIMGMIDNAKDPQRELNKRMSQTLHIINQMARTKKYVQQDETDAIDALENGDEIVPYKTTIPTDANISNIPSGLFQLATANSEAIGRVTGVREPMEGISESKSQSGIALLRLQKQGAKMARPILNNFKMTRNIVYQGIIDLIRNSDVYSMPEIEQIVPKDQMFDKEIIAQAAQQVGPAPQPPRQPNPEILNYIAEKSQADPKYKNLMLAQQINSRKNQQQYQQAATAYEQKLKQTALAILSDQLKSWSTGRYGTKVSQQPVSEVLSLTYAQMLLDLKKEGMAIPDDIILEALNHPAADKIIERMKQVPAEQGAA